MMSGLPRIGGGGGQKRGVAMAKVLVVDDDPTIRRLVGRLLDGDHEIVGEAVDGPDGL